MAVTGLEAVATGVNLLWVLVVTFLIFFMHAGFAMLEAGQVRAKNVANQLTKNLLTWSVGVLAFFLVGAAVSTVAGAVTGSATTDVGGAFAGTLAPGSENAWVGWLFGAVFAMTAATIVSGAVAGRAKLRAYVGYTIVLAAVIYPVVSGITWGSSGLLVSLGFHDFAGGMVVHGMGGVAGLVAAWVVGPRVDRFGPNGEVNVIPGHSITFAVLGTLILAFGWYGFNVGTAATVLSVADDGTVSLAAFATVGRVALTTTLAMAAGAVGAGAVSAYKTGKVDTLYVANGLLAGLVGITGITDATVWPGAIAVGLLAGAQLPVVFELVEKKLGIDDVCAVFPVHGSAGVLGALAFPFVATGTWQGGFDAAFLADALVSQTVGVVVIVGWTAAATAVVFGIARALGQARVSESHERDGLDVSEHGVETYPEFGGDRGTGVRTDGSGRRTGERPAVDGSGRRTDDGSATDESDDLRTDGGTDADGDLVTDGGVETADGDIELVMAVVRPDRLGDVKTALAAVGAPSLTVTNVSGRGSQPAKTGQWRGEEYTVDLHQKVKVECVVADVDAEDVADAILDAAHTGEKGDGKVFVLPVAEAYQVRTGKTGPDAV